jgi:hypothetical protein
LGEVYKPEDLVHKREKPVSDLLPTLQPARVDGLLREIELLKVEIVKIKRILRENGIMID